MLDWSPFTRQTHAEVFDKLLYRTDPAINGTMFYAAETGSGKTTGYLLAIPRLLAMRPGLRLVIMVRQMLDVSYIWSELKRLGVDAGGWSLGHDPTRPQQLDHESDLSMTRKEAAAKDVLVITHICGKGAESWVGHRDAVICDEYPNPIRTQVIHISDFNDAMHAEKGNPIFKEAYEWAKWYENGEHGLMPVSPYEIHGIWFDRIAEEVNPASLSEAGKRIYEFAQDLLGGRVFVDRSIYAEWVAYSYDMPFEDQAIVFSATVATEGWQYDPVHRRCLQAIEKRIDYRNVKAVLWDWPESVKERNTAKLVWNKTLQETFVEECRQRIMALPKVDTLVICPKGLKTYIEAALREPLPFRQIHVVNWGSEIGSNQYKDCEQVVLISEFHLRRGVTIGHVLGHSKKTAGGTALDPYMNINSTALEQAKNNHYHTHLKQMIARGACRNVDAEGVAVPMTVYCMIKKSRFLDLPQLFRNIQLDWSQSTKKVATTARAPVRIEAKILQYLSQTEKETVTGADLLEVGIKIVGVGPKERIKAMASELMAIGWTFKKGSRGRYGKPDRFLKV